MAELLASLQDINGWFTEDKLVADDANTAQLQIEAQRLIRGQLASSFSPTVMAAWISPTTTPDTIRSIAGRLIAAFLYKKVYSEEGGTTPPPYAQDLYNMAMSDLVAIRSGTLTVVSIDGVTVLTSDSTDLSFFPDNTTQPYFTMDQVFG